jgi:predicted hotdog family 3-hydroxylacyl-ACP dehydratase
MNTAQRENIQLPQLPCDATGFIPHAPPMLCIERILQVAPRNSTNQQSLLETTVPQDGPFLCQGEIVPEYLIELSAQAAAAVAGYRALQANHDPPGGRLAAVDHFRFHHKVKPGDSLRIALEEMTTLGSITVIRCSIRRDSCCIAEGRLKLWQEIQES